MTKNDAFAQRMVPFALDRGWNPKECDLAPFIERMIVELENENKRRSEMSNETIPDRASNGGPENATADMDWRDLLWAADEDIRAAKRMEQSCESIDGAKRNRNRIVAIESAIEALQQAKEMLC